MSASSAPVDEPSQTVAVVQSQAIVEKNKARRNVNFSEDEKTAIVMFVKDHKMQLWGKAGRPGHGDDKVEERKANAWKRCTDQVNQVAGNDRSWKKVKKQWQAIQDKAKKCKESMQRTGGGKAPKISMVTSLAIEVMAKEALEGIRSFETELDPTGTTQQVFSQDSSQESESASTSATPVIQTSTLSKSAAPATSKTSHEHQHLQQRVSQLEGMVQKLSSQKMSSQKPAALERQSELRQLKFQEELLKLEKRKVDLQQQNLEVQRKLLEVFQSAGAKTMLNAMCEQ